MVAIVRRRFLLYLQVGFLFVGGLYLLSQFDQLPTPTFPEGLHFPQQVDFPWRESTTVKDTHGPYPAELSTLLKGVGLPPVPEATSTATTSQPSPTVPEDVKAHDTTETPAATKEDATKDAEADKLTDTESGAADPTSSSTTPSPTPLTQQERLGKARSLIPSILDPENTSFDRLSCPTQVNESRYGGLRPSPSETKVRFFFAINLRQCVGLLPRLMGSVMQAINFLGPQHCALSIVEGNSDDGTAEVLSLLKDELEKLGVPYYLTNSRLNPSKGDRIEKLSFLRAIALAPVSGPVEFERKAFPNSEDVTELEPYERVNEKGSKVLSTGPTIEKIELVEDATIIFLNDVAACTDDILELVYQRDLQAADMTCAMDWSHRTKKPLFYDVWVSRAINGDTFFEIPANGSWDRAETLFYNEPVGKARFAAHRSFQVFACWNGAVAFTAAPIVKRTALFRTVMEGECFQGEPQLFCKDMWWAGYGKIAVVPTVNLEYEDKLGRQTKMELGYTHEWVEQETSDSKAPPIKIDWKGAPDKVKCMPGFDRQSWMPWNETLVDLRT